MRRIKLPNSFEFRFIKIQDHPFIPDEIITLSESEVSQGGGFYGKNSAEACQDAIQYIQRTLKEKKIKLYHNFIYGSCQFSTQERAEASRLDEDDLSTTPILNLTPNGIVAKFKPDAEARILYELKNILANKHPEAKIKKDSIFEILSVMPSVANELFNIFELLEVIIIPKSDFVFNPDPLHFYSSPIIKNVKKIKFVSQTNGAPVVIV